MSREVKTSKKFRKTAPMVEEVKAMAEAFGMEVVANVLYCHGYQSTWHVMFNQADTNRRLLEWWPTNGKWWNKEAETKGTCLDAEAVVMMAHRIKERLPDWEKSQKRHLDSI
jgi:hypothetical protein